MEAGSMGTIMGVQQGSALHISALIAAEENETTPPIVLEVYEPVRMPIGLACTKERTACEPKYKSI